MKQSTIVRRVACRGVGLHSGKEVEVSLHPAAAGSGIVFAMKSAANGNSPVAVIPASVEAIHSSSRATTLAIAPNGQRHDRATEARVATVEHLLAAVFASEIDNVRIDVEGSEIPVMDGSAMPFVECLRTAGRSMQPATRKELTIDEGFEILDGPRSVRVEPADALRISYAIDFAHPCIGRQVFEVPSLDEAFFAEELASARTFGFADEVEELHRAGLALGGRLENTVVLDEESILNDSGLRWPDEFVRHKIVDLIGDLALLGARPKAHIQVERGGHRLHHQLVQALRKVEAAKNSSPRSLRVPLPASR